MIRDFTYEQRWYGLLQPDNPEAATILFGPEDSQQLVMGRYMDYRIAVGGPAEAKDLKIFRAHFEVTGRTSPDDLWSGIKQGWARYKQRETNLVKGESK